MVYQLLCNTSVCLRINVPFTRALTDLLWISVAWSFDDFSMSPLSVNCLGFKLTQFFTLGVVCNSVCGGEGTCVIVHVGTLIGQLPRKHRCAMNSSFLFRACGRSVIILFCNVNSCGDRKDSSIAEETDKLLGVTVV